MPKPSVTPKGAVRSAGEPLSGACDVENVGAERERIDDVQPRSGREHAAPSSRVLDAESTAEAEPVGERDHDLHLAAEPGVLVREVAAHAELVVDRRRTGTRTSVARCGCQAATFTRASRPSGQMCVNQ
jgi:hypothetical protein